MTRSYSILGSETPGQVSLVLESYVEMNMKAMSRSGQVSEEMKMNWPLFIGLLVTFIGLSMTAIGLMLQKLALNKRLELKEEDRPSYFLDRRWLLGMTVFCIGNLVFFAVLALVPQTVLACWQCWAMVITILLAPLILGEMVTMAKLLNVLVIVAGVVWVVMASPGHYEEYSSRKFWAAVHDVTFICISFSMLGLFIVLLVSQWWELRDRTAAMRFILIAAIINWYSVLAARCSSGFLLSGVLHQNEAGIGFEFWLVLSLMLTFAIANVHFLNKALECDKAIFVVPVYESLAISGQILFGIIFFREFDGLSLYQTLNISFAVAVVIGGVLLSSLGEPDTPFLKQIVISEELCACCFCCPEVDEAWSPRSPRSRSKSKDNAGTTGTAITADPQADSSLTSQEEPNQGGYRRKGGGPRGKGDGGPRDPRGSKQPAGSVGGGRPSGSRASQAAGDEQSSDRSANTV